MSLQKNKNKNAHLLCLLVVLFILLCHLATFSQCSNSFDRLTFKPIFPKSHKWDYACQRVKTDIILLQPHQEENMIEKIESFDLDYRHSKKRTNQIQLLFSRKLTNDNNNSNSTFMIAYSVGNSSTSNSAYSNSSTFDFLYTVDENNNSTVPMKKVQWIVGTAGAVGVNNKYQVSQDIFLSSFDPIMLLYGSSEDDENNWQQRIIYFEDYGLYNRSECYDLANHLHYVREYYMNDCRIAFIVHSIFLVPMLIMFILSILTCRGHLAKRRSPTSIIGNVSMLFVFVVSLPFYNGVSYNLYKHSVRAQLSIKAWYTYCQVFGIIIGLVIAVTSYLATMLRYFHLRLMYRLSFTSVQNYNNNNNQESPRWKKIVVSKWFYWPLFAISITTLYVVLAGVTLGLRYAHVGFINIYTALDVVDIDFLVILGILLFIYCIDMLVHIKKLIKKGPIHFFWVHDPLLFRLEALIAIIFFVAMTAGIVVYFEYTTLYPYARAICFDVAYFFALPLFGNGLITLIQAYRYIVRCIHPSNQEENEKEMLILLSDDVFFSLFRKYCRKEFSSENLQVFAILEKVKSKGTLDFESYDQMYQLYLRSGATFELNLPSSVQQACSKIYQEKQEKKQVVEYEEVQALYIEVLTNLEDTFNRFKTTSVFQAYKQEKQALEKEFHLEEVDRTQKK